MHLSSLGLTGQGSGGYAQCGGQVAGAGRLLLLPHHPPEVFLCNGEEPFELPHTVLTDIAGPVGGPCLVEKPDRFLVVGLGDVEGVFQGCVVLERRIFFHAISVVPIPG